MFRDVPECSMFLVLSTRRGFLARHRGMQSAVVLLSFAFFPGVRGKEMVNPRIKAWKSFLHLNSLIFVLESLDYRL